MSVPNQKNFRRNAAITIVLTLLLVPGCMRRESPTVPEPASAALPQKTVVASHYGDGDGFHGKQTASGEPFDANEFTAAHRTYPLGTIVEVKNPANGQTVRVRINDRGPFVKGREIDLSSAAARKIGLDKKGVGKVEIQKVTEGN